MSGAASMPQQAAPTIRELFTNFLRVGVTGFGGVMPFARRMLIDERAWLTEQEFIEALSLAQFLPGPNIVNLSIIVGRRFQGPVGALVAPLSLLLMPLVIVLLLAAVYAQFSEIAAVRGACNGISAAASGLILTTALKMARPLRHIAWQVAVGILVFVAIGLLRLPLLWVVLAFAPLAIAIAWWKRA